ncbi:uncharacterized protein LOC127283586 [Leptopilina boulardi]|uniref:uncharacterized protein LOC127283586 n=1 Tax=Leptopilina boulardi TaxID=63433 RepID=UPI0021F52C2C|nr:uncharacterized protein LOC127283586 [Leptopilina boulardi]
MNEVTCTIQHSKCPETLMDQLINKNKITDSLELDSKISDTISPFTKVLDKEKVIISKLDSNDLLNMNEDDSIIETLVEPLIGGFYDLSEIHKFANLKEDDVQMPEVSSTEKMKNDFDNSLLTETNLAIDTIDNSNKIITKKPRIISNKIIENKIQFHCKKIIDNNNSKSLNFEKNNSSETDFSTSDSLMEMEDCLGFSNDDIEQSFKTLNRNIKKEPIKYNFPNFYRETPIILISETKIELTSYLRFNLPDQIEPLKSIGHRKNLIKPSKFHFNGSGYTELDILMRNCNIMNKKKNKKKKQSNKKNKLAIIQKGKLKSPIKKKAEIFVENNKEERSVERRQTRFLLKTLNHHQSLQLNDTPKSNNESKPRARNIISEINKWHLKDVRIHLERMEIIKEYAHLDFMNTSPFIDSPGSSENEQSLSMDESSKKEIFFATRRSDRLRKSEIKGIISLKSKQPYKQNKRVSFSKSVLQYEYDK